MESAAKTLNLALQYHQGGHLQQAELHYRQILQVDPQNFDALHLLGVIANQVGRNEQAVDFIQQALRVRQTFPEAHNNLGNALRDLGKLDEAISCYQQALRLKPNYSEAHSNLGIVLAEQGKLDEAIISYRQALHLSPRNPKTLNNLGTALANQGKLDEAITSYEQALRGKPNYAEAFNNLGNALKEQGKLGEAIKNYRHALHWKLNFAEAHNNLGNALRDQGKLDEARASFQEALRLRPDYANAHCNLGLALAELGRLDEAIASFRQAIRLQPKHTEALGRLTNLLRSKLPDSDLAFVEQRLAETDLNDTDRVTLLYSLAEVCDARSEYARASALVRQANELSQSLPAPKGPGYHLDENMRFVENLMEAFTPAFFERMRGFGLDTERPVFIVGLPRSGTTLTEQILAAHSQVFGAGELPLARDEFLALGTQPTDESVFAALPELPGDAFHRLAQQHLDQLDALNHTAARVVDKMPSNFCYLGLLAAMFPRARFIHCRRDLRDVAVSCWMTPFVRWSKDPAHILTRFQKYERMMAHWRSVLPVSILEVQYEETVADLPGAARRLVEWCGLDWEPACVKFNEGHRPVRTPSKLQVREPIFTRSVGRWRNYEAELSELFAALKPLLDSES